MTSPEPNTRRAFLRSSALAAIAAAVAAACGKSGGGADTAAATTSATAPPAPTTGAAAAASTTRGSTASTAPATSTRATTAPAGPWELQVSFAYVAASGGEGGRGGGFHNPYVAVWIEDASGKAVRTLSLNYQKGKGDKWLPDLRRWYRADQARVQSGGKDVISTLSAATRVPGTYNVAWDGKTDAGAAVANGTYFVCIEAAREKGPYSLIREEITVDGKAFEKTLAAQSELQSATAKLVVK